MAELTLEQKKAIAIAKARLRAQGAQPASSAGPQWSDLPGNIPSSAAKFAGNAAQSAYQLLPGTVVKNAFDAAMDPKGSAQALVDLPGQVYDTLKERYGGLDAAKKTAITDPVGAGADLAAVFSAGAGLAGRGPLLSRAAQPLPAPVMEMPSKVRKLLRNAAPDDLAQFKQLGPDAMMLDASPALTGLAQGSALQPNAQVNRLAQLLEQRDAGRSARLRGDTVSTLGNAQDPANLKTKLDKLHSKIAAPHYQKAIDNAPQLPDSVKPIADWQMTNPAAEMSLSTRKAYSGVFDELDDALMAGDPSTVAARLHDVRKNLDARIVYDKDSFAQLSSADKAEQAALKSARATVDDILKNRLGFDKPDSIIKAGKVKQESLDFGYNSLEGGKTAMFPETFNEKARKLDLRYVKEGQKARIYNAMGTQSNDLAALKKMLGGDGDFNRDKLAKTFTPQQVDTLVKAIDRESLFSRNSADILRNSQTARRQAAADELRPMNLDVDSGATLTGLPLKAATRLVNVISSRGATNYASKNAEALIKALTLKGVDAAKALEALKSSPGGGQVINNLLRALTAGAASNQLQQIHSH